MVSLSAFASILAFSHRQEFWAAPWFSPVVVVNRGAGKDSLDHHLLQALVCAHISEENNSEQVARAELEDLDEDLQRRAYWASQRDGVDWITVRAK